MKVEVELTILDHCLIHLDWGQRQVPPLRGSHVAIAIA